MTNDSSTTIFKKYLIKSILMTELKTLLIVDDEPDIREIFSLIYAEHFNILVADSGKEAFKLYKDNHIDIILSDLKMPNGDGAFLAKSVAEYDEKKPCPFFIMTANLEYNYDDLLEMGVKVIFSKPFDFDQFLKVAHFYLTTASLPQYTRRFHRVKCQMSSQIEYSSLANIGDILDFSPAGFLLKLPKEFTLKVGDKIKFNFKPKEFDSIIEGEAECRWVIEHPDFALSGFQILYSKQSNQVIKLFNHLQITHGEFH